MAWIMRDIYSIQALGAGNKDQLDKNIKLGKIS
jgi:hypothetical protein